MNDKRLEELLTQIGSESIIPSEEMIIKTKKVIRSNSFNYCLITLFIILSLCTAIIAFYSFFFATNIFFKFIIYFISSLLTNCIMLLIILLKEHIKSSSAMLELTTSEGINV